jgi:hypothetical protein
MDIRETDQEHPHTLAIERAIIELLQSYDAGPGDLVDVFVAQHEIERKGIGHSQFSAGVAQLLSRGVISLRGNSFFLTEAGYEAVKRTEVGGCRRSRHPLNRR